MVKLKMILFRSDMIDFEDVEWCDEDEAFGAELQSESSDETVSNSQPLQNGGKDSNCCHELQQSTKNVNPEAENVEITAFNEKENIGN
jgi:hypothetical protein